MAEFCGSRTSRRRVLEGRCWKAWPKGAEMRGFACIVGCLSGLCAAPPRPPPGGRAEPSAPPLAPIATAQPPSTSAHERVEIWIVLTPFGPGPVRELGESGQTVRRTIGSGLGAAVRAARIEIPGRGEGAEVRGKPRRRLHGTIGGAHVN